MELQTIGQVSKLFGISSRTLRYYEQIGLIQPIKNLGSNYRAYSEETIAVLRQIVILKKLRIPLKQIQKILFSRDISVLLDEFERALSAIKLEINALSTIRNIIEEFIQKLAIEPRNITTIDDSSLRSLVESLASYPLVTKEEKTMSELNKADERLSRLTDKDVRVVYIPPMTVAAIRCVGGNSPETETGDLLFAFIENSNLSKIKPDFRHFGFNHPSGSKPDGSDHGYERWVSIPDDMEVQKPFVKKTFTGGLYGSHMIPMGLFEEWQLLYEWATNSDKYDIRWGNQDEDYGFMEEHLNAINHYHWTHEQCDQQLQLDLLLPLSEKSSK